MLNFSFEGKYEALIIAILKNSFPLTSPVHTNVTENKWQSEGGFSRTQNAMQAINNIGQLLLEISSCCSS